MLWNTFDVYDFGSWESGAWILQSGLPYAPGIGFYGNGDVWAEGCFNVDGGGSYWVHSSYGDELSSFADYAGRQHLADVMYIGDAVATGEGVSGGHEYLAIIGRTSNMYDPSAKIETYYGWVELDGKKVVASAITADGPLRIGTGEVIPEPSGAALLLMGLAGLLLRRNDRVGDGRVDLADVNPDQFEILGATESEGVGFSAGLWDADSGIAQPMMNGGKKYKRIFIRRRRVRGAGRNLSASDAGALVRSPQLPGVDGGMLRGLCRGDG